MRSVQRLAMRNLQNLQAPAARPSVWAPRVLANRVTAMVPPAAPQRIQQAAEKIVVPKMSKPQDFSLARIDLMFAVKHHFDLFAALVRNLFQSFRPILMMALFGQVLKAFAYGVFTQSLPLLAVSAFYSVFVFEVFYTFLQMFISFVFISFFHHNLYFRGRGNVGLRRTAGAFWRQGLMRVKAKKAQMDQMRAMLKKL